MFRHARHLRHQPGRFSRNPHLPAPPPPVVAPGPASAMNSRKRDYSDDIFADTRMSFGDHLDELRHRMWNALKGLLFCLIIGFILDGIGSTIHSKWFGLGKPVLELIKAP